MKSGTTMRKTTTTMREESTVEGIAMNTSGKKGCMIEDDSGANKSRRKRDDQKDLVGYGYGGFTMRKRKPRWIRNPGMRFRSFWIGIG